MLSFFVIGCGSIGQRHIANLISLGVDRLIAFDTQAEQRELVEKKFKVKTVSTLVDGWMGSPSAALIATPSNLHIQVALEAARHNCQLFVEKPISHTLDDIDELISIVNTRRLITMVGCNMRFHPGPAMVKKLLSENAIGEIIAAKVQTGSYLPRWRPAQDYHQSYSASEEWGGAILDCIHEIDLALWYLGPATFKGSVSIPARSIGLSTDGLAEILLQHETGAVSNIHLNFVQRDFRRSCQIIGSEGTIYWDFEQQSVQLYNSDGKLAQTYKQPEQWTINQMYIDELEHFIQAINDNVLTINPISGGKAALEIALSARNRN